MMKSKSGAEERAREARSPGSPEGLPGERQPWFRRGRGTRPTPRVLGEALRKRRPSERGGAVSQEGRRSGRP